MFLAFSQSSWTSHVALIVNQIPAEKAGQEAQQSTFILNLECSTSIHREFQVNHYSD